MRADTYRIIFLARAAYFFLLLGIGVLDVEVSWEFELLLFWNEGEEGRAEEFRDRTLLFARVGFNAF